MVDPNPDNHFTNFNLGAVDIFYLASLLSSSDIIAAVTLVKYKEQPVLFSIILGEGLFNDAVALILFTTMKEIAKDA